MSVLSRFIPALLVAVAAWSLSPSALAADGERAVLRAKIAVASELVTIGDLFINAGLHAETAVFRAPDLGETGFVHADIVAEAAREAGLVNVDTDGVIEVSVSRKSLEIDDAEIREALIAEITAADRTIDPEHLFATLEELFRLEMGWGKLQRVAGT